MHRFRLPLRASAFITLLMAAAPAIRAEALLLTSPDCNVTATISVSDEQRLTYALKRDGVAVIEPSPLGIIVDGADLGVGVELGATTRSVRDQTYPWRGVKSRAIDHANELAVEVVHRSSGVRWSLEARAYDDGFAFRYVVPGEGSRRVNGEATAWVVPAGTLVWHVNRTTNYEAGYQRTAVEKIPLTGTQPRDGIEGERPAYAGFPLTLELPDGGYAAVLEADVMGYSGMTLRPTQTTVLRGVFEDDADGWMMKNTIHSPWRITLTGPDLNALVNGDLVHNVCPPPDPALFPAGMATNWVKPGRSLWQWWAYDDAGTHWSRQKAFIDQAALLGCDYYLVDEGWEHTRQEWFQPGQTAWPRMKELCDYAKTRGVAIWAWRAWRFDAKLQWPGLETEAKREEFFRRCAEVGLAGVKIDFMNSESHDILAFYADCLRLAAKHRIMVNFHGANKPAGEPRTWPNEMTREAVWGLEHNKWSALPAAHYATLPFTRFLAGHADFTPFALQPKFLKGTTATLQMATSVLFTSPLLCWADKPEVYLAQPEVVDFMRDLPTTWDETLVLPASRIGALAAFARRRGDDWYVAMVNGDSAAPKQVDLVLNFLGAGSYRGDLHRDTPGHADVIAHESGRTVRAGETVSVLLQPAGGFVAVFRKRDGQIGSP